MKYSSSLIFLFVFLCLSSAPRAQDYKKEFEQLWKSGSIEKQAEAILKLGEGGDLNAAKLMMKCLLEIGQIQEKLEAQIEAKAKDASPLPEGNEKKLALQSEVLKLSEQIAQYEVIFDKAGEAIKKITDEKAINYLAQEAFKCPSINVKIAMMMAVGGANSPEVTDMLIKSIKDKSPQIRQLGVEALKVRTPPEALDSLIKLVTDKAWQVRSAVAETLGKYKDARAIEPLIEQLQYEKGRLLTDFDEALSELTGEAHEGNYTVWRLRLKSEKEKWIERLASGNKEESSEPKSRFNQSLRGTVKYYSSGAALGGGEPAKAGDPKGNFISRVLVPDSERLVYIIDISGSMNEEAPAGFVKEAASVVGTPMADKMTKMKVLLIRFVQELPKLQPHQNFGIIVYNHEVQWWKKELIPATKPNIAQAQDFVKNLKATNLTNTFGALEEAFNMAGRGSFDKNYNSGVDTIILISDGLPSTGKFIVQFGKNDKEELREKTVTAFLDAVVRLNQMRRIKINCVGVPPIPMDDLLGGLAADNGGTYQYWELK